MKITTQRTYKKDKYYDSVVEAVNQLLTKDFVVSPVQVFIQMGKLTKKNYEDWRFGRIPYLEKVVSGNLSVAVRILRILHLHALACNMTPSTTVYNQWGAHKKIRLRFSKYNNPRVEEQYSTHYVSHYLRLKRAAESGGKAAQDPELANVDIDVVAKK